jgi:hypothetical protein
LWTQRTRRITVVVVATRILRYFLDERAFSGKVLFFFSSRIEQWSIGRFHRTTGGVGVGEK